MPKATDHQTVNFTDRRIFWALFGAILVTALVLRLYQIDARPLHSDEGVNWHFLQEISRTGIYPYSHENYHGPLYFWLSYAATRVAGESVLGLRLVAIVCGVLLCLAGLCVHGQGRSFALAAALLAAVSPSLVFHSRYGIHEMLFVLFGVAFGIAVFNLFCRPQILLLHAAALSLAGMVCTKETFVITLAAVAAASIVFGERWVRLFKYVFIQQRHETVQAAIISAVAAIFVYSSALLSFKGVREIFLSVPQWVGRGVKSDPGHFKPFFYYLGTLIWPTEPYLLLIFGAAAAGLAAALLLRRAGSRSYFGEDRNRLGLFLFVWSASIALIYSAVPYKTPWLVVNLVMPAILFSAFCISRLLETDGIVRLFGQLVLAGTALCALHATVKLNYASLPQAIAPHFTGVPYGQANPFSYVHTSPGMLAVVADIQRYWEKHPHAKVLAGTSGYWPLPYYLRNKSGQVGYFKPDDPAKFMNEYSVFLLDHTAPWQNAPWPSQYHRLSDVTEAYVYFKPDAAHAQP